MTIRSVIFGGNDSRVLRRKILHKIPNVVQRSESELVKKLHDSNTRIRETGGGGCLHHTIRNWNAR